jgi:hypothetical protein
VTSCKMIAELNRRSGPWMGWKSHWKKEIRKTHTHLPSSERFRFLFATEEHHLALTGCQKGSVVLYKKMSVKHLLVSFMTKIHLN